jgi:membrane protein implicated in regulation of membrane protease activity
VQVVEFLTQYISWWHWIVLGILFIIIEMGTGTFITLGFGIAAVIVGLLVLLFGLNFLTQTILWILLSVSIIAVLFKYFKRQPTVSSSGQSDQGLSTLGTVTETIEAHGRGRVRFDHPVLGNTIWHASSDRAIEPGERVAIEEVNGQLIKVIPISH